MTSALQTDLIDNLVVADFTTWQIRDFTRAATSAEISLTLDGASQVTLRVRDEDFKFGRANYFQIRRPIIYRDSVFEIASVEVQQGQDKHPEWILELRTASIQLMKRDKSPQSIGGASATDFARIAANKYGLKFEGQGTSVARNIASASTEDAEESVWDVIQRLAGEAQFVAFESDGTLYFAQEKWLIGKWGNITFEWPPPLPPRNLTPYHLIEIPNVRSSDDAPDEAEFTALLAKGTSAQALRPGMTVTLKGIPNFQKQYLIDEVAWQDGEFEAVTVSARSPEEPEEEG